MKDVLFFAVLGTLYLSSVKSDGPSATCMSLAQEGEPKDGSYLFNLGLPDSRDYIIYCDFELAYGYTFISAASFTDTDISAHNVDDSDFKVVLLSKDGKQYETVISLQWSRKLDIKYVDNRIRSRRTHVRNWPMYPYITAGVKNVFVRNQDFDYVANGINVPADCPKNEFNFRSSSRQPSWSFFFNSENESPIDDKKYRSELPYLKKWVELSRPASITLPRNFFTFFETSVSLCDEYVTSDDFPEIVGGAIGLKYVITCKAPPDLDHGYYKVNGHHFNDTVKYFCNEHYEMWQGDDTLFCDSRGVWRGQKPDCRILLPRSCSDVAKLYNATLPGEYVIYSQRNIPNMVYCEFNGVLTTTFIPTVGKIDWNLHFATLKVLAIVIRISLEDGRQVESILKSTEANRDIPIEVQMYAISHRSVNDLIVRFGPKVSEAVKQGLEKADIAVGYNLNGEDVETIIKDCCVDRNGKGVMFYSHLGERNAPLFFRESEENPFNDPVTHKWLTNAVEIDGDLYMPTSYFKFFLMFYGYHTFGVGSFPNVTGLVIGVRTES